MADDVKHLGERCRGMDDCSFFQERMQRMPATAKLVKKMFCEGDYSKCARYMVGKQLGARSVPSSLAPSDTDVAHELIGF